MSTSEVHYHDYLQLDRILQSQFPESAKNKQLAHDEMLFIVIHQAYELWFKQLHHESDSVIIIMSKPALNDNSPELQVVVHRLSRMVTILRVLVHQIDIMETMTPMDFLDFRDMLRPASGFQSWQFKMLEAKLGLKFDHRHGQEYYTHQLKQEHIDLIKKTEKDKSLLELVNAWLERMPFCPAAEPGPSLTLLEGKGTAASQGLSSEKIENIGGTKTSGFSSVDKASLPKADMLFEGLRAEGAFWNFWEDYKSVYANSLAEAEKNNIDAFDQVFFEKPETLNPKPETSFSPAANRAALFIMLYRGYPMLQLPFQLLNNLLEIDEQLSTWRHRHMNMVHRMIGTRVGTGGSSGKDYLKAAADKHYVFKEIAQLTSFLIERRKLPVLPAEIEKQLGFVAA